MVTVSVGICSHNEEETIGELLDQILAEEVPLKQVIVVVAGDDRTDEIVKKKMNENPEIELVREKERRGQSAAQNEIFERATEDALFLIDGDGWIKEGSLERLWAEYDGDSILYGREIPETPDNFTGRLIDRFWELHHRMSLKESKYTTQLALQPTKLIDHIPKEIVIDDEFIGLKAVKEGYRIKYVPGAEKHHNIKGDMRSFLRHRRKNWAGMFQIQSRGNENLQNTSTKAKFYLENLVHNSWRERLYLVTLGALEFGAFIGGFSDALRKRWPYRWKR